MISRFQKWWNRGRFRPRRTSLSRRWFLVQGGVATTLGAVIARHATRPGYISEETGQPPVRPPGAGSDDEAFRARCIRCGLCGTVCENGCIRYFGLDEPNNGALTPFIDVRRRSCTLCMRCTQICPTGALKPIEDDRAEMLAHVAMGSAVVDPQRCLSYLGRVCGYCHDACPFPNDAIQLTPPARPLVLDGCVGCGRCVEDCPQNPTAIDIRRMLS